MGVRRYQNKDGTLTSKGRARYYGSNGKKNLSDDISKDIDSRRKAWEKTRKEFMGKDNRTKLTQSKEYKETANELISLAKQIKKINEQYDNNGDWDKWYDAREAIRKKMSPLEDKIAKMERDFIVNSGKDLAEKYYNNLVKELNVKDSNVNNLMDSLKRDGFFDVDKTRLIEDRFEKIDGTPVSIQKDSIFNELTYEIGDLIDDADYMIWK